MVGSFAFAFNGLRYMYRHEPNAKIHLLATLLAVVLGFLFHITCSEWLWIALAIALVWMAEAMNTAIEVFADHLHPQDHPMIGRVKDLCAGVVVIAALFALVAGLVIFLPKITG